jgi:PPK2 family polyphosphate:nucleotide phosphotransferase
MEKIKLSEISTLPPSDFHKEEGENRTDGYISKLKELQNVLFAQSKYSILIILQGMDASGKDGVIKKVFSGINPMGCRVAAFKKPTEEEMKHDFLWRIHKQVPEKGMIQIFNRSQYEDVIIQRVHTWVDEKTILRRYEHINHFESLLQENNTIILKFYLHVSQKEQLERLSERLSDPKKMWKYNPGDKDESKRWPEYMDAYERVFTHCGPDIRWTIVPSDKNWYKEYLIAKVLIEALERLELKYPVLEK